MIFAKDLLLKGGAGLALCVAAGVGGVKLYGKMTTETLDSLTDKVGLSCTPSGGISTTTGVNCTIKTDATNNKLKAKKDSTTFDVSTITGGVIKVYKDETHSKGFKFVIEDGDISAADNGSNKLEQFETYEIKKEDTGNEWRLTRKNKVDDRIEAELGLPSDCKFSTTTITCSDVEITTSNVASINFEGKDSTNQPTISGGTASATVTKESSASDFPYGYKFSLKGKASNVTITIGSSTFSLKQNESTDFKIKKTGNKLTLEEAWNLGTLTSKVGLECPTSSGSPSATNGVNCTIKTGGTDNKVKVKQDTDTSVQVSTISNGKIKVYKDDAYNKSFKFVIEDNDIGGESSKKLEQFETYEIKEESNTWYLTRKEKAVDVKKKLLGLPSDATCKLPENSNDTISCTLDEAKLKAINFEGKNASGSYTFSGTPTLKISKSSDTTTFPNGAYKFVFETDNDIIVPKTGSSSSITIKKKTNPEFKIKKEGNSLSLEKAWTVTSLGQKVGLNCPENGNNKECTLNSSEINVHNGNNKKHSGLSRGENTENKKVKYETDVEGYNQGFKFYTEESDGIALKNGSNGDSSDDKKIETKGSGTSEALYEIKETDSTWYLTKKTASGAGS